MLGFHVSGHITLGTKQWIRGLLSIFINLIFYSLFIFILKEVDAYSLQCQHYLTKIHGFYKHLAAMKHMESDCEEDWK